MAKKAATVKRAVIEDLIDSFEKRKLGRKVVIDLLCMFMGITEETEGDEGTEPEG